MKTLVILCVVFACSQAEIAQELNTALDTCTDKLQLNKETIVGKVNKNTVSEDDEDVIKFYECFSKEVKVLTDDGKLDFETLSPIIQNMVKQKLGDVPDVDSKSRDIATDAINQCKDIKADTAKLTVVRVRNCIKAASIKLQQQ